MTEKRYSIEFNERLEMMQYVDNQKEEPNKWAIWNASETAQKLNDLNNENEQLKEELEFWKKQAKQCPMRDCKNDQKTIGFETGLSCEHYESY